VCGAYGVALVLAPEPGTSTIAQLEVSFGIGSGETTRMMNPALEALRAGIPAARSLPLLAALARSSAATIILELSAASHLRTEVTPMLRAGSQRPT
jgi:hypothetical protein